MTKFDWGMKACSIFLLWATAAIALPAQTFITLHSFIANPPTDGYDPVWGLVQGTNGSLYGTTLVGGTNDDGTVFKITPSGTVTALYNFCSQSNCTDGFTSLGGLVQGTDGNLYGTTFMGGANTVGTVFKITPSGTLTTLFSFDNTDGANPSAGLVQGTNGKFYGTTSAGGASPYGGGTVFSITASGTLTTLHSFSFCSQAPCTDGYEPYAALVQGTDGNFYGTTLEGGANSCRDQYGSCGTVFKITPGGKLTTLHSFDGTDGWYPDAGLVQATDGDFYGTTEQGGANDDGTVFKITASGKLTTLYAFGRGGHGKWPIAGLIQATNGKLYGTTGLGGNSSYYCGDGCGTVFEITPSGKLTTLHSFDKTDGDGPRALIQDTDGNFYGTTDRGGAHGRGTVFSLSVGLGPFIETNPTSGKVGANVRILGSDLTGASSVTFNGTAATFTVKSKSEITTTVPTGATTGTVQVVTPSGTLSSNVPFTVK
jgi:uncharacterized repeat protein (TIGR03803 family)